MNNNQWTDQDLSKIREERGFVESAPTNSNPSYKNSEHYYNELEQQATIIGDYKEGVHYAREGVGNKEEESYVESAPTNSYASKSWTDYDVSRSREEWGSVEAAPSNNAPSYYNSEHYLNEGLQYGLGPNINGKTPSELISSGLLTGETLKAEDKEVIFQDIMLGITNNKNMLSNKLDLILSDQNLINRIVSTQYRLAVEEMRKEKKGFVDHSTVDRKFQFLTTVNMLMEKGYNLDSLSFTHEERQIGIAKLLSNFRSECNKNEAKSINDPSWFKTGQAPENYDTRKVNNPWLFTGVLITELYNKNPNFFEEQYENYKATSNRPANELQSYEDFIYYSYGIKVPTKVDNLQQFKDAREKQMQQDQIIRQQQLSGLTQELVETKEGHSLR